MRFAYRQPRTIKEALEAISAAAAPAGFLAGGTDLLVTIQEGVDSPALLVDIGGIAELKRMEEKKGRIYLGPAVTAAEIIRSGLLRKKAGPLCRACGEIGSPQIRSRATIGGNIVTASPCADSVPSLLVLKAVLTLTGPEGKREVPIGDFFTGVKATVLQEGELLTLISFPACGSDSRSFFRKLGQRRALAIAKLSVAGLLEFSGEEVTKARIALGAVAPTAIRALETEVFLTGKSLTGDVIGRAAEICAGESKAITDIRSTADYRNKMIGILLARGLEEIKS